MYFCKNCNETVEADEDQRLCAECGSDRIVSLHNIYKRIQDEEDFILPQIMALFNRQDALMEERPWYVPTLNTLGFSSPNLSMEITLTIANFSTPESTKKFLLDLRDKHGFGKIFQWTVCPECSWDVPVAEITVDGNCFFCLRRNKEEAQTSGEDTT